MPFFGELLDFQRGVKVTGAGFPFYVGDMARLVRSLLALFLDEARNNGYRELMCPIMVNAASATATGQLPDKEGQMYHDAQDDYYMIPTAELPLRISTATKFSKNRNCRFTRADTRRASAARRAAGARTCAVSTACTSSTRWS